MRHHNFFNLSGGPRLHSARSSVATHPPGRPDDTNGPRRADGNCELRDLIGWMRQRLRGEHTVRACVLTVEPLGSDGTLLLLGEADASGSADPPRLKVRVTAAELAAFRGTTGEDLDPAALVNRIVTVTLQTSLRQRYGRGAGVQARVTALLAVGAVPLDGELERERTLQRLRREGRRFGLGTWAEPEDPRHIALIVSEFGEARRDVEHVLRPFEESGVIHIHRVWATFEGPGAERALGEAFGHVRDLHRELGLSATLVCRGGGPVEGFQALNAYATARAAAEVPNLIAGLGHAGTPHTALDAVAARSEPTPTAAAMLVRQLVEATGVRAERALAAYEAALAEDLEAAGRIALSRATQAFDRSLRDVAESADRQLRQLDRAVEHSLLAGLAAATGVPAGIAANAAPVEALDFGNGDHDADRAVEAGWALVTAADTGNVIAQYGDLRSGMPLFLHFRDGTIFVQVVPTSVAYN